MTVIAISPITCLKLPDGTGKPVFTHIPEHAVLRALGPAEKDNMLELEWMGMRFLAFAEDIVSRTQAA